MENYQEHDTKVEAHFKIFTLILHKNKMKIEARLEHYNMNETYKDKAAKYAEINTWKKKIKKKKKKKRQDTLF